MKKMFFSAILFLFLCGCSKGYTTEEMESLIEESESVLENKDKKKVVVPKETNVTKNKVEIEEKNTGEIYETELTESDYKDNCLELWHDDIFFSDENLKGKKVKLHIYTEEHKFFNLDNMYNTNVSNFIKKYDIQKDILCVGVKREDADSYVGGQINLYFSNKYDYSATDYETGLELIIYGDIVDYSTNTWDGYNVCGIIPRYIE